MSGHGAKRDPTEVFAVVSNETRLSILRALADAHGEAPTDPWMAYRELQDAAGIDDNGNFNYHLDRLGDLVVAGEEGYRISRVGMTLVSAVSSGTLDTDWTWGPVDVPGTCPRCDDPVSLRYADGILRLACEGGGHEVPMSVPPAVPASFPDDEVVETVAALEHQWAELVRRGICSECHGRVEGRVEDPGEGVDHYHYRGECRRCGYQHGLPVGTYLANHPDVVAFYHGRGVDVRTRPFWTLEFAAPGAETVVSTDPLRLRVAVAHGNERLALTVDREGDVVDVDRSGVPAE